MPDEIYIDPNSGAAPQPGGFVSPPAVDQDGQTDVGAQVENPEAEAQAKAEDEHSEAEGPARKKKSNTPDDSSK